MNELEQRRLDEWCALSEDTCKGSEAESELAGWVSSYTGDAIPKQQMDEWLHGVLVRLSRLNPHRVLEIGCGSGMIMSRIAPGCESYVGTDISAATVERLRHKIEANSSLSDRAVTLQCHALDFSSIPDLKYDTAVLNSVIQYFPSARYLRQVLEKLVASSERGGRIFVGDVRNFDLINEFHFAVELYRSTDEFSLSEVKKNVEKLVSRETELLVAPQWFINFASEIPRITYVEILPKLEELQNEMSAFRYDVVLWLDDDLPQAEATRTVECRAMLKVNIVAELDVGAEASLLLKDIKNPLVYADVHRFELALAQGANRYTVGEFRAALPEDESDGLMPGELSRLSAERGYQIAFSGLNSGSGTYDAFISLADDRRKICWPAARNMFPAATYRLTNDPLQASYWKTALAGIPVVLGLPTDRPRPAQQAYTGGLVRIAFDAELSAGLKRLSQRHGTTLFMTLLTGWAIVLSRLSVQEDFVIGTPVAYRGKAEVEPLIGFFVNTLALRIDLSGEPSAGGLLQRVKAVMEEAQQHQDLPFEQVVEIVQSPRSLSYSPVFQVFIAWQNNEKGELALPVIEVGPDGVDAAVAKFDLSLYLQEGADGIAGSFEYAVALFDEATVRRQAEYLRKILQQMVADESQRIYALQMLSEQERQKLLVEWNRTEADYPKDKCIHALFEAQAKRTPDAVAVVYEQERLSYGELNRQANRLARHLRKLGVGPDVRVAICVPRSLGMMVGLLGVLKAGGAYVPLDPGYPPERLQYMLEDSATQIVLTHGELSAAVRQVLSESVGQAQLLDLVVDSSRWQDESGKNLATGKGGVNPAHLAYVIYTSGSTGKPKGVMVEHGSVCNLALAQIRGFAVEPQSRILQFASISFDACIFEIVMALCQGASLYLVAQNTILAGEELIKRVRQYGITHVTLPPAVLAGLPEDAELESVRTLIVAGEALTGALVKRWSSRHQLINAYGPTETTVWATMYVCHPGVEGVPFIGRPIANVRIYLLDVHGEPVPIGVAGEIYIGGAGVARGYLNRPELTQEKFVADPFAGKEGAKMYRTGDLGRYSLDGNIEFLGRNDHQIKIRGFRIELGEIEARLREHGAIREAVVIAREDGSGDKRLVAYYCIRKGQEVNAEQLRDCLSAVLPEYMVPAVCVELEAMPQTHNDKLDRKALPAPERGAYASQQLDAPQGEVETVLARIWCEVLEIKQVGRHDNFFKLGGHSLLAVELVTRMHEEGLPVAVRSIFTTPTLAALAASIGPQSESVLIPANRIVLGATKVRI